jgi:hypothetical protein
MVHRNFPKAPFFPDPAPTGYILRNATHTGTACCKTACCKTACCKKACCKTPAADRLLQQAVMPAAGTA